ncbi:NAD(P)/FAD-dependent oxidoreductase [Segnochrobactrum spirostomi]|uniref:FAD-binding oxidoreductase n=1 Tax=Segnochrobactrum spirostomi TaxID=2608987 RepID=A0A6A7Y178_9HYPH|nr:FAD-binding oxidoreductase [Segnochrobactrum spirostomi]MQT12406.1 FAD-binding oxidoreductase [Segnochrobactrum spirostomi]
MTRAPHLPSTYLETAEPGPAAPPLDGDRKVSVAIVGGGYTGLSTALHLAERGVDVALVEANEIGWGCSGRNGGQVNPGLKPYPDDIERDYGPELGRRMIAFSYAAPDFVFDLIAKHGIACEAERRGTIRAAINKPSAAGVATLSAQFAARGMAHTVLDRRGVAEATGTPRYVAALFDPRGGAVNPLSYARGLATAAIAAGARLHAGTRARKIVRNGSGWRVETATGTLSADHVVIGTNGYTDDLWPGLRHTIVPVYSAIAATEPLPQALRAAILPGRAVAYEVGWDTVYYRVSADGRLLMGGRGPQRPARGVEDYHHLTAYAERLWPGLKGLAWTHFWWGQVAITADHYPHLHEPAPGLHIALGYNGRGVAMATAMGDLLSRRILGASIAEIELPVTESLKPIAFHGLWPIGVTARVIYGRLRDRLGL